MTAPATNPVTTAAQPWPDNTGDTAPKVGIIYNQRSHRNRGQDLDIGSLPNVTVAQPATHDEIEIALQGFRAQGIDYLIINGGDGTVRDVLTCAHGVFGENWPDLAVLPKGKTNALNVDLGAPTRWTLSEAIAAYGTGRRVKRHPLAVECAEGGRTLLGFILGAGGFTLGVRAGQDAHRMGAFDSFAVGVTSAWGVLQGLLGSDDNIWRRGVEMTIRLGNEARPLPRSQYGDPARRTVMMSSTLEKFPVGIKLFGKLRAGLKLVVMDHPRRRLLAVFPAILAGWSPPWLAKAGVHYAAAEHYELEIGDEFILDGEAFPAGTYRVSKGPELSFVVP
ncbi:MAG: diacylglycerol kinase family protein [Pontixanthobacter sp.]